uniref:Odorant binding protein n=1 Tax=Brugia timori TaxID=42155 RepID=A0A0R3RB28_9BILA
LKLCSKIKCSNDCIIQSAVNFSIRRFDKNSGLPR